MALTDCCDRLTVLSAVGFAYYKWLFVPSESYQMWGSRNETHQLKSNQIKSRERERERSADPPCLEGYADCRNWQFHCFISLCVSVRLWVCDGRMSQPIARCWETQSEQRGQSHHITSNQIQSNHIKSHQIIQLFPSSLFRLHWIH